MTPIDAEDANNMWVTRSKERDRERLGRDCYCYAITLYRLYSVHSVSHTVCSQSHLNWHFHSGQPNTE